MLTAHTNPQPKWMDSDMDSFCSWQGVLLTRLRLLAEAGSRVCSSVAKFRLAIICGQCIDLSQIAAQVESEEEPRGVKE